MPLKYTFESKFYFILFNIYLYRLLCPSNSFSSTWFLSQKSTIEEVIIGIKGAYTTHWVIYYLKFSYELIHIEYFWCDKKSWIRRNCKYSIERLRKDIPKALAQVKGSTILRVVSKK